MLGPLAPGQLGPLAVASAAVTYAAKVKAIANLVAYWQLTESSGTSAVDSSGNGYNGVYSGTGVTLSNVAGAGGSMGNAPTFDGSAGQVTLTASGVLTAFNKATHTVSLWMKNTNWLAGLRSPFTIGNTSSTAANGLTEFYTHTNGSLHFEAYPASSGNDQSANAGSTLSWFHGAIVIDTASHIGAFYFNGSVIGVNAATTTWGATPNVAKIANSFSSGNFWPGAVGHVAIYSRALAPSEITTLATAV